MPLFFQFLGFLELPLLVVVYFALMRRNQVSGLLIGAVVGLAQDSLSKNPLGMFGIVNTLVGYFASSIGVRLDVDNTAMRLVLIFFFFVFHQFFYWVLARALAADNRSLTFAALLLGFCGRRYWGFAGGAPRMAASNWRARPSSLACWSNCRNVR